MAYYALGVEQNPFSGLSYTWIRTFAVIDGQKGKGIFRQSFEEIQRNARQQGHVGVRLYVNKESEDAYNIYIHYGFIVESVKNMELDTIYNFFHFYSEENIMKNVASHYEII